LLICLLASIPTAFAQNTTIDSFNHAKKLLTQVFAGHETEFYCGCTYAGNEVDLASCGYQPKKDPDRASASNGNTLSLQRHLDQSFPEWREGHPACVDSKGKSLQRAELCQENGDTSFDTWKPTSTTWSPPLARINGLRSNYSMEMIPGEKREFGACDVEIENRKIEPRPEIRGDIARTYMYMEWAYPGHGYSPESNQKLFEAWNKEDPVDDWERERASRIEAIQGNRNPFIWGETTLDSSPQL